MSDELPDCDEPLPPEEELFARNCPEAGSRSMDSQTDE